MSHVIYQRFIELIKRFIELIKKDPMASATILLAIAAFIGNGIGIWNIFLQSRFYQETFRPVVFVQNLRVTEKVNNLYRLEYDLINSGQSPAKNVTILISFSTKEYSIENPFSINTLNSSDSVNQINKSEESKEQSIASPDALTVDEGIIRFINTPREKRVGIAIYPEHLKIGWFGDAVPKEAFQKIFEMANFIHIQVKYSDERGKPYDPITNVFMAYPHNLTFSEIGEYLP